MSVKTENLAIVLTDITGLSEAAAHRSRADNARLFATHHRILLPIIRCYRGRQVKSIGDALLLVFRSPTDAMLSAMAMQDALFEYNRTTPGEQQIHIRIAASLGEVRVTRHDVIGEAVNLTGRLQSITPPDEIYFSEAVYMAMNKAEVPSQEVAWRELKGMSAPIRLYNIPRFAAPRLVPQDVMAAEDMSDLVYPFGGAHLAVAAGEPRWVGRLGAGVAGRARRAAIAALVLVPAGLAAAYYGSSWWSGPPVPVPAPTVAARPVEPPAAAPIVGTEPSDLRHNDPPPAAAPVRPSASPTARTRYQPEFTLAKSELRASAAVGAYTRISDAKRAYQQKRLSKDEYKKTIGRLETAMRSEIGQAKRDYKDEKITRKEYKDRIDAIERQYK